MQASELIDAEMRTLRSLGIMHETQIREAFDRIAQANLDQQCWTFERTADGRGPWMQTYTGRAFYVFDAQPEDIDIRDIAHALANMCRFAGHCKAFWSIGQHSIGVSTLLSRYGAAMALKGLLHDASEAYISDVIRPLKRTPMFQFYLTLEEKIQNTIYTTFAVDHVDPEDRHVKWADNTMLATEKRDLFDVHPDQQWEKLPAPMPNLIVPDVPSVVEQRFLSLFEYLTEKVGNTI